MGCASEAHGGTGKTNFKLLLTGQCLDVPHSPLYPSHTWLSMIFASSMYLSTCTALASSSVLNCSNDSKKYEYAVL